MVSDTAGRDEKSKQLSDNDLAGINIDELLFCPFCEIMGKETPAAKPQTRTTFRVVDPVQEVQWCDIDTDEHYDPNQEQQEEGSGEDYKTDSEGSCSEDDNIEEDM